MHKKEKLAKKNSYLIISVSWMGCSQHMLKSLVTKIIKLEKQQLVEC